MHCEAHNGERFVCVQPFHPVSYLSIPPSGGTRILSMHPMANPMTAPWLVQGPRRWTTWFVHPVKPRPASRS